MTIPYLTAVPLVDVDRLVDPWNCESVHGSTDSGYRCQRLLVIEGTASQDYSEDQVDNLVR